MPTRPRGGRGKDKEPQWWQEEWQQPQEPSKGKGKGTDGKGKGKVSGKGTQSSTLSDADFAVGGVAEEERRRGEAVERAVRLAKERADRALVRGGTRGLIAGVKRGATEAAQEGRALRPRATPGTAVSSVRPGRAIAGEKRGTRAMRASEKEGGLPPGEAAGGERSRRKEQ